MINTVCFDIGHTLVSYNNPLNWSALYRPALLNAAPLTEEMLDIAEEVLKKYNTRINYREKEYPADVIFGEIYENCGRPEIDISAVKRGFFAFFRTSCALYPDAKDTLARLKALGMKIGVLTDVAYGMDDFIALDDIAELREYVDVAFTSVNVGFRKPNPTGFRKLLEALDSRPEEAIYIGDEEKDIRGANTVGMTSVLINRTGTHKNLSQDHEIESLAEIIAIAAGESK